MTKTYARARNNVSYLYLRNVKGHTKILDNQINHPTYLRVTQPDKLDNEYHNVIIQVPRTLRSYRVASIDLEFLTEKEMIEELRRD